MIFNEKGKITQKTIILLHGGGLSDWSWKGVISGLKDDYNVVTAVIDGHGQDANEEFKSIEDSAAKLAEYIEKNHGGHIFALAGLSIGAQIICELLSKKPNIADYAVIESALVIPIKMTASLTVPTYEMCYGLIKQRWFAKMQAKSLYVPSDMFENYYNDSLKITKQSLINIALSNGNYPLKAEISKTTAKVLIIVGEKEISVMKKSAQMLEKAINGSRLYTAKGLKHGQLSLEYPQQYLQLIKELIQ